MIDFTVVSLDEKWREFMVPLLQENSPYEGENLNVSFLTSEGGTKVSDNCEKNTGKKIVLFTHPGVGPLGEYLLSQGASILNGGQFADATHTNPDFVTLEAAKHRFFVAPVSEEGERTTHVLVRTKRGIVPEWLTLVEHRKLHRNGPDTHEGVTLGVGRRDEDIEKKIDRLLQSWGYIGFVFVSGVWTGDEFSVEKISAFGPESFWPAFFAGFTGNIAKFFCKMENSRRLMSSLDFTEVTTLRATLPPYPYHKTPWVENEEERRFVENHLAFGAIGVELSTPGPNVVAKQLTHGQEGALSSGADVAFISGASYDEVKEAALALHPALQIKELN